MLGAGPQKVAIYLGLMLTSLMTLHPSALPAEFAAYIRRENERWGKVIKDVNIKPK